jgi:Na+/proline symporter
MYSSTGHSPDNYGDATHTWKYRGCRGQYAFFIQHIHWIVYIGRFRGDIQVYDVLYDSARGWRCRFKGSERYGLEQHLREEDDRAFRLGGDRRISRHTTMAWILFCERAKKRERLLLGREKYTLWAIAMSTTATQCGAISMMSIPAFVALASGGGMKWLQLELAVPLAVILVMALIIPTFYRSNITTAYEYLERRFSPATRSLISFMFLLSRGLATGCAIYAPSFLLSTITGFSIVYMILLVVVERHRISRYFLTRLFFEPDWQDSR